MTDIGKPDAETAPATEAASRKTRRSGRWAGILQISAVFAFVALAVVFAREPDKQGFSRPVDAAAQAPVMVNVVHPDAAPSTIQVAGTGAVNVRNVVPLAAEVNGRVVWVATALRAGGSFEAGEPLLRLDPRVFELALDQARADLAGAEAKLLLQRAESDAAVANWALINGDRPVPPLVARTPQIAQGEAQVAAAEARLALAHLNLDRTTVSLPFAGRIASTMVDVGQHLGTGKAFAEAFSNAAVEATVPLTLDDLARLEPVVGRSAQVSIGGRSVAAVVERVSATVDPKTRFARVFLAFTRDVAITPGAFVEVTIDGPTRTDVLELPIAAQQPNGTVWVVAGNTMQRHRPEVISRGAEKIVVARFDSKDGVVIGAVPGAREGLPVALDESVGLALAARDAARSQPDEDRHDGTVPSETTPAAE